MSANILLVEDETSLADALALNLRAEGYTVTIARTGREVEQELSGKSIFGLVLLDVMLPDLNGFELCERIKQKHPSWPVIFLSAKSMGSDRIKGLGLGADDYITKPFELEELLLRVRNLLKRTGKQTESVFQFPNGSIDFGTFEITDFSGKKQVLSKREIGLLELLTSRVNQVVSRDEIIERLWLSSENPSARTIDNYILAFRKYFEPEPKHPRHFHSVRGVGYRFTA